MKKYKIIPIIILLLFLSACSVQEKVSPEIFKSRIEKNYPEFVFENDGYYLNDCFYVFACYNNNDIAFKIGISENYIANKISLSFEKNESLKEISEIIRPVIEVFSPNEDGEIIIDELINTEEGFYYSYGKEYSYSLAVNEKNIYFEVFNNRLSNYTIPELTLKQNDKTTF